LEKLQKTPDLWTSPLSGTKITINRVIEPIEKIYFAGLLPHFLMFGERKGGLTAIVANGVSNCPVLQSRLNEITDLLDIGDSWPSQVVGLQDSGNLIISDDDDKVSLYLSNLMMLWELGLKAAKYDGPRADADDEIRHPSVGHVPGCEMHAE
jgi:hypothetical protein